jgi:hypothetical protein
VCVCVREREREREREMAQAAEMGSRERRWSLQGMTALVTGGTKGIGFALFA